MTVKVGLSLGAGGARGLAHIGVLEVLRENNIPIDLLAGSSMGAIVAAAYAAGADLEYMAKMAVNLNQTHYMDVTIPKMGLLKGDRALEIIRLLTHRKDFTELNIPLAVIATDLEKGEKVIFTSGNVAQAVRASISIPGIFQPVRLNGRLLVDAAVKERLPVEILKEMGAGFIIGVDVKTWDQEMDDRIRVDNIYEVIMQTIEIMEEEACKPCFDLLDVLINPKLYKVGALDFGKAEVIIAAGRKAALEQISEIKEKLARADNQDLPGA